MMGQTLARRSMQNPEQHWKSSDVSLARPVSFAPLCNNPISCFCLVTGLYPSTKFVRTYLYFFPRKLSLINEIKVGQKKGFNGAQYFFFTFTCHCFLRAILRSIVFLFFLPWLHPTKNPSVNIALPSHVVWPLMGITRLLKKIVCLFVCKMFVEPNRSYPK